MTLFGNSSIMFSDFFVTAYSHFCLVNCAKLGIKRTKHHLI